MSFVSLQPSDLFALQNARQSMDDAELDDLKASILENGIIQPITIVDNKNGYVIIAGHRRTEAVRQLMEEKQLPEDYKIPCYVNNNIKWSETPILQVQENVIRAEMDDMDIMEAITDAVDRGQTVKEAAARMNVPRKRIKQIMALSKLHPTIRQAYRDGKIQNDVLELFTMADIDKQAKFAEENDEFWFWDVKRALSEDMISSDVAIFDLKTYPKDLIVCDLFSDNVQLKDHKTFFEYQVKACGELTTKYKDEGWGSVTLFDLTKDENEDFLVMDRYEYAPRTLNEDEQRELEDLKAQLEAAKNAEEPLWKIDSFERQIKQYPLRNGTYTDEQKANLQVIITMNTRFQVTEFFGMIDKVDNPQEDEPEAEVSDNVSDEIEEPADNESETDQMPERQEEKLTAYQREVIRNVSRSVLAAAVLDNFELCVFLAGYSSANPGYGLMFEGNDTKGNDASKRGSDIAAEVLEKHTEEVKFDFSQEGFDEFKSLKPKKNGIELLVKKSALAFIDAMHCMGIAKKADVLFSLAKADIRKYWTPEEDFLGAYTKDQLTHILGEIGCPPTKWAKLKKPALVELLDFYFNPDDRELSKEDKACVSAAETWLPLSLRHLKAD